MNEIKYLIVIEKLLNSSFLKLATARGLKLVNVFKIILVAKIEMRVGIE